MNVFGNTNHSTIAKFYKLHAKMIHLICLAHGLYRVLEKVREIHPDVNSTISSAKKVFLQGFTSHVNF